MKNALKLFSATMVALLISQNSFAISGSNNENKKLKPLVVKAVYEKNNIAKPKLKTDDLMLNKKAMVITFTFDDGRKTHFTDAYPILKENGFSGTFFINPLPLIYKDDTNVSWSDLNTMLKDGQEISSHGMSHKERYSGLSAAEVKEEVLVTKFTLRTVLGIKTDSIAAPFGEADNVAIDEIRNHYKYQFDAYGLEFPNVRNLVGTDPYHIKRYSVERKHDPLQVCKVLEEASKEKNWFVLEFHDITDTNVREYDTTVPNFKTIVNCVSDMVKNKKAVVLAVKEAAPIFTKK